MPDLVEADSVGAPTPGHLVPVRNRHWTTSNVVAGAVAPSDLLASFTTPPQHVVTLISIEDHARGEELRVVRELEYGAAAHDQHVLPSPELVVDKPARFDAFSSAERPPRPGGGGRVSGSANNRASRWHTRSLNGQGRKNALPKGGRDL